MKPKQDPEPTNPLWAFRSDAWRTLAMAIQPVCTLAAAAVLAHYAPPLGATALSSLVWLWAHR